MASINYWAQGQAGSSRSPSPHITRSGGRRSDLSNLVIGSVSRSGSGQSVFPLSSSPSTGMLGSARRRSTETTGSGGGMDNYYWSTAAGVSGTSSSTSSLAMSPSNSSGGAMENISSSVGSSTGGLAVGVGDRRRGMYRRSEASLRDLIAEEQRRGEGLADERAAGAVGLESPNWSDGSDYSSSAPSPLEGSAPTKGYQRYGMSLPANGQVAHVWNEGTRERVSDYARQSINSDSTARQTQAGSKEASSPRNEYRTPTLTQTENKPNTRSPGYTYSTDSLHATPIVSQTNFNRSQPSPSSYTPGSGRLDSTGISRGGSPPGSAITPGTTTTEPQSAPPWQAEFGLGVGSIGEEGEVDETTLKSRGRDKRATLPAMPLDPAPGSYLSPEKGQRGAGSPQPPPRSALRTQLAGISSPLPNLSFDYSPAESRTTHSPLNISPPTRDIGRLSLNTSPKSSPPMARGLSSDTPRSHLDEARIRADSTDSSRSDLAVIQSPASINDLTDLLGGAIDEIGLIDSRETPPPMISADGRDKPKSINTNSGNGLLGSHDSEEERRPITPRSLPSRGESLSSSGSGSGSNSAAGMTTVPAPNPGLASAPSVTNAAEEEFQSSNNQAVPQSQQSQNYHQRQTSVSTLHAPSSPIVAGFVNRPWPSAMLFGHIKNMKHSGDRAKQYAKSINELAAADSGLRDFCIISASSAHRVPPARMPLNRLQSNAPSRDFGPSIHIQPALPSSLTSRQGSNGHQPRTVSSSSEFPMREDSYTAREISQRIIDPSDEPTSLPTNLPYPQLQQVRIGGMRNSPSTASMASMASTSTTTTVGAGGGSGSGSGKKGFFKGLRGKKDSGGLGPPTGPVPTSNNGGGGAGKKDVRGLQISNPERSSLSGVSPLGPRGPRMGSFTSDDSSSRHSLETNTPYRSSLDTGMNRLVPPNPIGSVSRASFDSGQTSRSNLGSRLQAAASGASTPGVGAPREDDVRSMQDVLPHVDRGVLRAYLAKHGDQMSAITAYFEDEKRGSVRA